ncbi:hypothetical protein PH235_00910 [Trichococcus sp. K1Tr]|uniref:hypothetical protein n=1 Tax=Trichococcus sp. K1Tr TaxID=3020847 RepID=UPI00232D4D2F|nr:hypothetical protein [Trichococcus sp. K1Tr]MDB6352114.1 hypothetical protein [Trichococcus sp. K1Tr]
MISLINYEASVTQSQSIPIDEPVVPFRAPLAAVMPEIVSKVVSAANQKMGLRYQMGEHMYNCVPHKTLIYQCQNGMLF